MLYCKHISFRINSTFLNIDTQQSIPVSHQHLTSVCERSYFKKGKNYLAGSSMTNFQGKNHTFSQYFVICNLILSFQSVLLNSSLQKMRSVFIQKKLCDNFHQVNITQDIVQYSHLSVKIFLLFVSTFCLKSDINTLNPCVFKLKLCAN